MGKIIYSIIVLSFFSSASAQKGSDNPSSILAEGSRLYRSEMASWYGTDIFLGQCKDKSRRAAGYFSYADGPIATTCVYYSKDSLPTVLARITFDSSFSVATARIDSVSSTFTSKETSLYKMRKYALNEILNDTLFKRYDSTELNLIPLISNGERKVYVLTASTANGKVIFGNDYLLMFDDYDRITEKKCLHANIIMIKYGDDGDITMHTHTEKTGQFITATDICTLWLYGKIAKWKQHYVMSKKSVSVWDCTTNSMATLPREAWDRINKDSK